MSKFISIKKNTDFRRLYRRGKTFVTPSAVAYVLPNRAKVQRLGITAGKKIGGAVVRNRAKRRLRAVFHNYLKDNDLCGRCYDVILVARVRTAECRFDSLKSDVYRAIDESLKQLN